MDDDDQLPQQCAQCEAQAVGYDDGTPLCAEHYQSREPHPSLTAQERNTDFRTW